MRMLKTMDLCQLVSAVAVWSTMSVGCGNAAHSDMGETEQKTGRLTVECAGVTPTHDVTAVAFVVVSPRGTCADDPIASVTTPALESEALPASLLPAGAGTAHPFADGLFVLAPGQYRVCATPLTQTGPSTECAPAEALVVVNPEGTNEIVLMSQCKGDPNGGLDVALGLNDPPLISGLTVTPSKFISVCERARLTVSATDPNGDRMTYSGTILSGPAGTPGSLTFAANVGTFIPGSPGDYQVKVTVTDGVGGSTSLQLPIHVTTATCTLVSLVGDKDNFASASDPADNPPVDAAFAAAFGDNWAPTAPLDNSGYDHRVFVSHILALPSGAVVQGATLQLHVRTSSGCTGTEFIFFDSVIAPPISPTDPRKQPIALDDVVGEVPVDGGDYTFDVDLAVTPVRDIASSANEPIVCDSWDNVAHPAPKVPRNLLPQVQSGVLNMLIVDDTNVDYSQLTVQYTIP